MYHVSCGRSPLAVSGRAPESRRFNRFLGVQKSRPGHREMTHGKWWCRNFSQRKTGYHGISWYIHELMGLELYFLMRKIALSWLIYFLFGAKWWSTMRWLRGTLLSEKPKMRSQSNHWPSVPKSRGFACVFPGTGEPRRMVVKSPSEITNEMDGNHD